MELEPSMVTTDRQSGSSFRYDTYKSKKSLCNGGRERCCLCVQDCVQVLNRIQDKIKSKLVL